MSIDIIGGDTPLAEILAHTELNIRPGEYVLIGLEPDRRPRLEADLVRLQSDFVQYIVEPDVLTVLLNTEEWSRLSTYYPEANIQGPLRIFTFSAAMDWDVVGFLTTVTGILAQARVPLGAICGYYRDHLFISTNHAFRAEAILRAEIERRSK